MEATPPETPPLAPETTEKKRRKWLPLVVALVVIALIVGAVAVAFLYQPAPTPGQVLDHITVTPTSASLDVHVGASFTAKALDAANVEITAATFSWSLSPSGVALLSSNSGKTISAQPYKGTQITLTVTSTYGSVTKSATATITVKPYADHLTVAAPTTIPSSSPFTATVSIEDQYNAAFAAYNGAVSLSSTMAGSVIPTATLTFTAPQSSVNFTGIQLPTPGQNATLHAADTANASIAGSASVQVGNRAPTANFTLSSSGDQIMADASTSADPDGTIAAYSWSWGDASPAGSGRVAFHNYTQSGTYTVALTVTDNLGATGSASQSATVNALPVPLFQAYVNALTITVNATASHDPDGSIVNYRWDWGDASPFGAGVNTTHTYATFGAKTITLTLTDNAAATNSSSKSVTAKSPPIVGFRIRYGATSFDLIVNASSSTDPDGFVVSYVVAWGDTTSSASTPIALEVSHTYSTGANYTLTITVTDNDGLSSSQSTTRCVGPGASCPGQPVAVFTYSPTPVVANELATFNGSQSYDLNPARTITSYFWEFGDGTTFAGGAVPTATHAFSTFGTYKVNLTVTNDLGNTNTTSQTIRVLSRPVASFTFTATATTPPWIVTVDGTGSTDADGTIVNYTWDWGDSSPFAYGATRSHTYAAEGNFPITLYVRDNDGLVGQLTIPVAVGTSRIDYTYRDFFNVPFGEWWDMRTGIYGDRPLAANCFNATSIVDAYCTVTHPSLPTTSAYPYTNWYPSAAGVPKESDPLIYAPYRFDVAAKNISGYTLGKPVFIPNCKDLSWTSYSSNQAPTRWNCPANLPTTGGQANFSIDMQYLDISREVTISTGSAPNDCPDLTGANDGFLIESYFNMTLDYRASQRLFGVTGNPSTWWAAHTKAGCSSGSKLDTRSGDLEKAYGFWFVTLGNGPYDIFSSFEYLYTNQFIDISYQILTVGGQNVTKVTVHHGAWGTEVLLARLFYYGTTNYTAAVSAGALPRGWWGMELAWFEDFHMRGNLSENSMNFTLSSVMQYHYQESAEAGADGTYGTIDDQPVWEWAPILSDYIFSGGAHRYSELDPYKNLMYIHTTPGTPRYGQQYIYDYVPQVWRLTARQTQTFIMPTAVVAFHDPFNSTKVQSPWGIRQWNVTMTYEGSLPAAPTSGSWTWSASTHTLTVIGPVLFANPPLTGVYPLESRPIYVFRRT